ncbi:RNA-guided endonuclease IscB [Actinoplanes lobatus]|uniref:RNA-guided endonuclease IscB n=1 Tax=Actinoplanes lobatus TaxID=113568 RepID=UPI00165F02D8|nr:RNA-guided endonuclease IscB [Actinoplanes lobatus]
MFVLDRNGLPLQPCTPARARQLLRTGRAVVHRRTPFVIRLRDRNRQESVVQGVQIGVDPGSRYTGISLFTGSDAVSPKPVAEPAVVRAGVFSIEVQHRGNQIREKLTARAALRRGRRSRNLRYRQPRFDNRTRSVGWLAPSLRHRVETTMSWISRLQRWAPVAALHVERVAFDTQLLQDPEIAGRGYQQGTLHGYELREYLLEKWQRKCAYCGVSGVPLNLDHIRPRSRGGSDRASNLTLACISCNQTKGNQPVEVFLAGRPEMLARILAQVRKPLRDAAAVSSTRWALWKSLTVTGLPVHVASGGRTKYNRHRTNTPKSHTLDALHVGVVDEVTGWPVRVLVATATGRGTYTRTRTDRYGFPRLRLPRTKLHHGFQTGDLVRAVVRTGANQGTHVGRVAVRSTGRFNIRTATGLVQGIGHRYVRLLQRGDGWTYSRQPEQQPA